MTIFARPDMSGEGNGLLSSTIFSKRMSLSLIVFMELTFPAVSVYKDGVSCEPIASQ
jgi:hypothetical protein